MAFLKTCFYCGRAFDAPHALANICSPDCRSSSPLARSWSLPDGPGHEIQPGSPSPTVLDPVVPAGPATLDCPRCGKPLRNAARERRYCSRRCRRAMQRRRRNALIRHRRVEAVSLSVLRQRDGETCQICGRPVLGSAHPPHPDAGTIDHIIPLARGGEHSYKNTQLAHHRCNTTKGCR